jgi:hypothetical protein
MVADMNHGAFPPPCLGEMPQIIVLMGCPKSVFNSHFAFALKIFECFELFNSREMLLKAFL